jgi:ribokinase
MKKIAVVGSINIDYFVEADRLPITGETVLGTNFFMSIGGKGANQAVAAARLGAEVALFGSVGNDENRIVFTSKMNEEKVDISRLNIANGTHTGVAFIEISNSENRILVVPGANQKTDVQYIDSVAEKLLEFDIIIFQLETPIEMLDYIIPKLAQAGKTTILNPAPAHRINAQTINLLTYITPNEHEYQTVFDEAAPMDHFLKKFPNKLVVTCGTNGVKFYNGNAEVTVPSIKVHAVDTTGAGDTFSGAFAVALAEGKALKDAIEFANIAAGLSVRKKGAQTGMPTRQEIDQFMKEELLHETKGLNQTN